MDSKECMERGRRYIMDTYARFPVVLVRGRGARVWDMDGKEYLDFLGGIAVCNLGHAHPRVVEAVARQAGTLMHVSNLFFIEPQVRLAQLLVEHSFADKVFFCNSGAEANEGAIKLARRYFHDKAGDSRFEIIAMDESFHGRTMATMTATGQAKHQVGFNPLLPGFCHVPFDDLDALEKAVSNNTCAVMIEPIQGEGGIRVPGADYLRGVRDICDRHGLLLIYDEVQAGMGRTGTLFAYEESGVAPDIMTLAKALGNGFPVGALLATDRVAAAFKPGSHASTFGGNPLAMSAAIATVETILNDGILENVRAVGSYFMDRLRSFAAAYPVVKEVRGRGLMIGVELTREGASVVQCASKHGLLMNCTADRVLRFVPPLIINEADVDRAMDILGDCMEGL
ncbi:MAG: acetylornithine aminotransferase [delta proteobacterium MLS_D]|nr:MAG: acetylornithine aminotransferase [delta proteobacterium MLS_D]